MTALEIYLSGGLIIAGAVFVLWTISLIIRDSSIIDPFWGPGFVLAAAWYAYQGPGGGPAVWIALLLVSIWGIRLGVFLLWRNWGAGEDFRYVNWRSEAGPKWWWYSFIKVYLLQGGLMWIVSVPLLMAQFNYRATLGPLEITAVVLWLIGFSFEAGGDCQLARFKSNPENRGKVLNTGFWRFTRHPNYFGDALQWWAFFLFALGAGAWWTFYAPVIMTFLLLKVSGVVMLEKTLVQTKPEYAEYIRRTPAFLPWFPKSK